jgi:hypothetical protein
MPEAVANPHQYGAVVGLHLVGICLGEREAAHISRIEFNDQKSVEVRCGKRISAD